MGGWSKGRERELSLVYKMNKKCVSDKVLKEGLTAGSLLDSSTTPLDALGKRMWKECES